VRYAIYQTIAASLLLTAVCARGYQTWRTGEAINFIVSDRAAITSTSRIGCGR
jgi:hypothetical protein